MAYSQKFQAAFQFSVMEWEAVYDKNGNVIAEKVAGDPGGCTKYGIDQRDHPSIDVLLLNRAGAERIFHDGSRDLHGHLEGGEWSRIRGDDLNDDWSMALFDCAVNPGLVAVHWTQEILGVRADGAVGPVTIAAINNAGDDQLRTLLAKRDLYYQTRGPWSKKFLAGWLDRNKALRKQLGFAS